MTVCVTPKVRTLLLINWFLWFVGVLIFQNFILKDNSIFVEFGLSPLSFIYDFKIWQPLTYMFLHGEGVMHILFNSLILWFIGSELEKIWGGREFLKFYLVCGVGAGLIYVLVTFFVIQFMGMNPALLSVPTVGASGAIFGLMLAYGVIFGERLIYFMMLFPMKAKHFVMILAFIEVMSLVSSGLGSKVNNLAHIGGLLVGYLYLRFSSYKRRILQDRFFKKPEQKLKLVIDNHSRSEQSKKESKQSKGPTYH